MCLCVCVGVCVCLRDRFRSNKRVHSCLLARNPLISTEIKCFCDLGTPSPGFSLFITTGNKTAHFFPKKVAHGVQPYYIGEGGGEGL